MKNRNSEKQWFEGLKWAESIYQQYANSAAAEWAVSAKTWGSNHPFDCGARDYMNHINERIRPLEEPQLHAA